MFISKAFLNVPLKLINKIFWQLCFFLYSKGFVNIASSFVKKNKYFDINKEMMTHKEFNLKKNNLKQKIYN